MALVVALTSSFALPTPAEAAPAPEVIATSAEDTPAGRLVTSTIRLDPARDGTRPTSARPGWQVETAVAAGTQQVGLTWSGDPQAQFAVRTRAKAGASWSPWSELEGEVAEGPDAGGRPGAGPLWLGHGGVAAVQVRLANGLVSDVRLVAMAFEGTGGTTAAATRAVTIARPVLPAGGPPIRVRSSWATAGWQTGNADCGPGPIVNDSLRTAIVHHTDGTNDYSPADVPGIIAGIYRFHTQGRGWCDIAYNFFVDRFGGVWEGRLGGLDRAVQGGHAMGFNKESVGVALLGQYQPGVSPAPITPPAAMMTSLRDVLAWKVGSQGLNGNGRTLLTSSGNPKYPEGRVVDLPVVNGHRDSGLTSCPGDLIYQRLPQLRVDVARRVLAVNDPVRWRPHVTGARYFERMIVDAEGRVAQPSRIGTYTSAVVRAGTPQGELTASVVLSAASDARIGLVDRLYRTVFGRSPDTAGLAANVAHRDRGMSSRDLARNFVISGEVTRTYGALGDDAFTRVLYANALHRTPSAAEVALWVGRLRGGLARQDMVLQFSESGEARAKLGTRTRTTIAWYAMLRRAPAPNELATWSGRLAAGSTDKDLVVMILRAPEYLRRF